MAAKGILEVRGIVGGDRVRRPFLQEVAQTKLVGITEFTNLAHC